MRDGVVGIRSIFDRVACALLSLGLSGYSGLRLWVRSPTQGPGTTAKVALEALAVDLNSSSLPDSDREFREDPKDGPSKELFLRSMLTAFPMWVDGHLALGWLALSERRYNLAYGSSLAAIATPTTKGRSEALALKGACYLAVRDYDNAISTLEPLVREQSTFFRAYEDLVAAYIARGMKEQARITIAKIPACSRSQQLLVVERYLHA